MSVGRRRGCEKGMVLVATAVVIVALCLFTGLVIDTGILQQQHGQAQMAADAAAVAGAMQFLPNQTGAWAANAALSAATWNGFRNDTTTKVTVTPNSSAKRVSVQITRSVPTYFMNLVGVHSMPVTVTAMGRVDRTGKLAVLAE